MAEVAEFVAQKRVRLQAEASSLRLVENMLQEGLSVEQIEGRLANTKADEEIPGHVEGSSSLQPRGRLDVTPQKLVQRPPLAQDQGQRRIASIGIFNPIFGDLANVPALEIPMSQRTATTGLADEPSGSITDIGEAYARLRLLQESLSHYNNPNWWNKRNQFLRSGEDVIVEPMQTRSPKTLATVIGRQWEEYKNGMSTILRHFLVQLRSIAFQLHRALEDDIRSTDDPAHQILQGARPMYAQLVQSPETSRWVVEDCGKAANALHATAQTRSGEHKDLWLQFKSAGIDMLPPALRPPENVLKLLYIPLPRLTTPAPGFPDLERQHPWGKYGDDNAPAHDFDKRNSSPTEPKSGGMPDEAEEDAYSYSSSSANFEPDVRPRRFEFDSARPREGTSMLIRMMKSTASSFDEPTELNASDVRDWVILPGNISVGTGLHRWAHCSCGC
ncbi:hypothetical protein EPUS_07826 [Endocarpon pusillum Z07020]|uniref:Uncharacterized protein n=1 Tax=Endocarpon pusillum (strain Z07020 / HMAS-L-300199) TaxID=1263415 RepID=U1HTN7_ENDPU|nr:uncharacterized protein EPUS_07826 [Endocarpon pusillum Z07020]ERF73975.1 hypothetical protein EPUS_07826 [Endocarpon pusillum Z07020]